MASERECFLRGFSVVYCIIRTMLTVQDREVRQLSISHTIPDQKVLL